MAVVGPCAPDMADGVDAPRDVVHKEDPHQPAPDKAPENPRPGPRQEPAQDRRNQKARQDPHGKEAAHPDDELGLLEILGVLVEVLGLLVDEPPHVRVPHALDGAPDPVAVAVGGVGVVIVVAVLVVTAMLRNPLQDRPFDSHRSQDREQSRNRPGCLETPVCEVPVVPDRNAKGGREIHAQHDHELLPVEGHVPQERDRDDHARKGQNDADQVDDAELNGNLEVLGECGGGRHGERIVRGRVRPWSVGVVVCYGKVLWVLAYMVRQGLSTCSQSDWETRIRIVCGVVGSIGFCGVRGGGKALEIEFRVDTSFTRDQ